MSGYELRALGPPRLLRDGRPIPLRSRKSYALLVYLALEGPSGREPLADLLWEGERGRANLRVELHRIHEAAPGLLRRGRHTVEVVGADVDVRAFEQACREDAWETAYALYGGPFLEGVEGTARLEEWVLHRREQLREQRRRVLETLAGRADPAGALGYLLELRADDPLDEAACREAMRAYLRLGQPGKALELYQELAAFLERELNLPPDTATRALADAVRRGQAEPTPKRGPRFAGREAELEQLETAFEAGLGVIVSGEPGIGKTRLVAEFARLKGLRTLFLYGRPGDEEVPFATLTRSLQSLLGEGVELEPWVEKELARLLPELGPAARKKDPERLRAAVARVLAPVTGPEWLWGVDDLQYVDPATLRLLTALQQTLSPRPGVVTFRSGTLRPDAAAWVHDHLSQNRAVELKLRPLPPPAVARMLDVTPERAERLARYTGGNPFFLTQIAATEGAPLPPAKVLGLVQHRLLSASGTARRVAELAALAGPVFDHELAGAVLELRPLPLAEASDELERLGLFRDGRPSHDLVVEAVRETLSAPTQAFWHLAIAEALAARPHAPPALVAGHFRSAGHPERAVDHHVEAARAAARGFAYREALEQYERALTTAPEARRTELELATLEARYGLHLALLDDEGARTVLEEGERLATALNDAQLARWIRLGWAGLHFNHWRLDEARALAEALLAEGDLTAAQQAGALYIRAVALQARGEHAPALDDALRAAEVHPDPEWTYRGWAHNTAAISLLALGRPEDAGRENRTALHFFQTWGDLAGEANAERVFAQIAFESGRVEEAGQRFERARELAHRSGHRGVLGYVLAAMLLFFEASGDRARVRALAQEGAAIEGPYRAFFERRLA